MPGSLIPAGIQFEFLTVIAEADCVSCLPQRSITLENGAARNNKNQLLF